MGRRKKIFGQETDTPLNNKDAEEQAQLMRSMFGNASAPTIQNAVESGLLIQTEKGWGYGRAEITRTGMTIPDDLTVEEYSNLGGFLLDIGSRINWLLGDWLAYGENREWGETYHRVAEHFGYEYSTLRQYAYVCRNVNLSVRTDKLTLSHHQLVAQLEPDQQSHWLNLAAENNWSIKAMRNAMSGEIEATSKPLWESLFTDFRKRTNKLNVEDRKALADQLRELIAELER
jgi:hypothetical protein